MDLRFSPEEKAFRDEVRSFISSALPDDIRCKMLEGRSLSKQDIVTWQRILNQKGWAVPAWPLEWGGTGWDPIRTTSSTRRCSPRRRRCPCPSACRWSARSSTPSATRRRSGASCRASPTIDDWWCQGFSEPGAGSDLASLRTTAVSATATTTWSTGRRPGPPWRSMPTGSSASCAPTRTREEAAGHLVPADRHEDARHRRCARSRRSTAATRSTRCSSRCAGAGGEPGRRGEPGWDYAKFLLGNERRASPGSASPRSASGASRSLRRYRRRGAAADRGAALPRAVGRSRGGAESVGDHAAPCHRGREPSAARTSPIRHRRSSRSRARRYSRRPPSC